MIILALIISPKIYSSHLTHIAGESIINTPDQWVLISDSSEYPVQLVKEDLAEMLIFKSQISEDEAITDSETLKISVDRIIDEVILTLPDAQLLATSGYHEPPQIGFTLDFLSLDTITQITMRHRLKGILYRHVDNYQLLFTLWGKAPNDRYVEAQQDIETLQAGYNYYGEYEEEPFLPVMSRMQIILLTFVVVIILLLLRMGVSRIKLRGDKIKSSVGVTQFKS